MPAIFWRYTVHKNWLGAGGIHWANTYEAFTNSAVLVDDPVLRTLADKLVAAERVLHTTSVYFDRVTISTWGEDSDPYDPEALAVVDYGLMGVRVPGIDERVDLNGVYNVKRSAQFGRSGKLAYRGVLMESDINASASGFWQLVPSSPLAPGGAVFEDYRTELAPYFIGGGEGVVLMMIGTTGDPPTQVTRPITDLVPKGAGFNRMNHRWFNQATP